MDNYWYVCLREKGRHFNRIVDLRSSEPLSHSNMFVREREEFHNMIPLIIQIRLARTQKKKGTNTKFEL